MGQPVKDALAGQPVEMIEPVQPGTLRHPVHGRGRHVARSHTLFAQARQKVGRSRVRRSRGRRGWKVIWLTRLGGSRFLLNVDLIERLDETPDTVITLVNGRTYVVAEPVDEVLDLLLRGRRGLSEAHGLRPVLRLVPRPEAP